ncbi:MAG: LacI family DNA-binding transcriptional regulator [Lachnospiraceae bacterium]
MGITAKEIAQICGVSRTTVHRALNNTGRINPETKKLIMQTAAKYDYHPDMLATGLAKGRTNYIGVVMMDVDNRYFSQMLNAIGTNARSKGYFVNITLHENNKEMEREQLRRLADYHVEGMIVSSVNQGEEYKVFMESLQIPIVTIDNKVAEGIPFVGINGRKAAQEGVAKIVKAGYEKIVFVCPPLADSSIENVYVHEERAAGFQEAMESYPSLEPVLWGDWNYRKRVVKELSSSKKKTAFFCTGDMIALEVMQILKKAGKTAGKEYGLMGYDNIDFLQYVVPRLATIDNYVEQVAGNAFELLLDLIDGKECEKERILETNVIDGDTL